MFIHQPAIRPFEKYVAATGPSKKLMKQPTLEPSSSWAFRKNL